MTSITRRWSWRWFVADITILLALAVFQTIVNTNLPPTSDAVPLLGTLFVFHAFIFSLMLTSRKLHKAKAEDNEANPEAKAKSVSLFTARRNALQALY